MANAEQYTRQLVSLLPRGAAWVFDASKNVPKLLGAWALEFEIFDGAVEAFIDDFFPDTTTQFLEDWERILDLPDPCSGLAETVALRRKDVQTKLTAVGGQSKQYLIDLAAASGYTITIDEFSPFLADENCADDPVYSDEWQFVFQVNASLDTIQYFEADNNSADDPLASWGNNRLECLINKYKPAHTFAIFSYS